MARVLVAPSDQMLSDGFKQERDACFSGMRCGPNRNKKWHEWAHVGAFLRAGFGLNGGVSDLLEMRNTFCR